MKRLIVVLVLVFLASGVAFWLEVWPRITIEVRSRWMCEVCGADKVQSRWLFIVPSRPEINETSLGGWTRQQGRFHRHEWRFTDGSTWPSGARSHATAPPIYRMRGNRLLDEFVELSTDEEIGTFLDAMTRGSDDERQRVVDEACDTVFDRLSRRATKGAMDAPAPPPQPD